MTIGSSGHNDLSVGCDRQRISDVIAAAEIHRDESRPARKGRIERAVGEESRQIKIVPAKNRNGAARREDFVVTGVQQRVGAAAFAGFGQTADGLAAEITSALPKPSKRTKSACVWLAAATKRVWPLLWLKSWAWLSLPISAR